MSPFRNKKGFLLVTNDLDKKDAVGDWGGNPGLTNGPVGPSGDWDGCLKIMLMG